MPYFMSPAEEEYPEILLSQSSDVLYFGCALASMYGVHPI